MSFLAPLFMLGALGVAAPIVFHLIRRTSREKIRFSSLMFLQPTPPRMTRQSRLENLVLLLLRCLVLALLALGFARPFLQKPMAANAGAGEGRRTVVMVDVSASMRQEGLWAEAREKAEAVLRSAGPADAVALQVFDRSARTLMSFEQWSAAGPGDRVALAVKRLEETPPGWGATHLGNALLTAAEVLEESSGRDGKKPVAGGRRVVLISDLQEGARLDGLQGFEWPKGVEVDLQPVRPRRVTNAGLHLVPEGDEAQRNLADATVKVRVNNAPNSAREAFQVGWVAAGGKSYVGKPVEVYVPPGQSRVASVPLPLPDATGRPVLEDLRIAGDDAEFDNVVHHVPPKAEKVRVLFLGSDDPKDPAQGLFYLRRAFLETRRQTVQVDARAGNVALSPADTASASLLVATDVLPAEGVRTAREFLQSGRTVLLSLKTPAAVATVAEILGLGTLEARESEASSGYALLGQIDFQHPLFAPFADPRYSDFTKIHFWKHRVLEPAAIKGSRVVARFDRGDPALLEVPVGKGTLFVLASGWHPTDSQLALSSKFVPILYSLLELGGAVKAQQAQYVVGDTVALSSTNAAQALTVRKPDGREVSIAPGERFSGTDLPGVYSAVVGLETSRFAVNVDPGESRTAPLNPEELERLGVPLKPPTQATLQKEAEKKERLRATELEQRQKLWRWLLVAALVVLLLETALAGWLTRRPVAAASPA